KRGDVGKLEAVFTYAQRKAEAKDYTNALTALNQVELLLKSPVAQLQTQRAQTESKIAAMYASDPSLPKLDQVKARRAEIPGMIEGMKNSALTNANRAALKARLEATDRKLQALEQYQAELKAIDAKLEDWSNSGLHSAEAGHDQSKFSTQALRPEYQKEQTEV